jgi:hypothetical protein
MDRMDLPPGFGIPGDASEALWLDGRYGTQAGRPVAEAFPPGFTDFVRVLHPAWRRHGSTVRWSEAFHARARMLDAEASWFRHFGDAPDPEFTTPEDGSLPQPEATIVASSLLEHTTTPEDCWFVWSPVRGLPFDTGTPLVRFRRPWDPWRMRRAAIRRSRDAMRLQRSLPSAGGGVLVRGPLGALVEVAPTPVPSVWWPADHAWIVATGVDAVSTYIGAMPDCIDAIVHDPRLETLKVASTNTIVV